MKRIFDIFVAATLLFILSPVLLALALLVRLKIGSPVLFRQRRPGRGAVPFELVKFRTMTDERDVDGCLLPDDRRLVPFGRWLRSTSLDELPELINILRGEMSFVGPRPLLLEYVDLYSPEQAKRHDVRPGLTGWAQINGRNAISWEERFALDLEYVRRQSFGLDCRILALTAVKVLRRTDISSEGEATMARFTGSARRE